MNQIVIRASEVGIYNPEDSFPWAPPYEAIIKNLVLLSKHLLPCPFCGTKPIVREAGRDGIKATCSKCHIPRVVEFCDDFVDVYHHRTKQSHTKIPWTIGLAGTMTKVIKLWNTRVTK